MSIFQLAEAGIDPPANFRCFEDVGRNLVGLYFRHKLSRQLEFRVGLVL